MKMIISFFFDQYVMGDRGTCKNFLSLICFVCTCIVSETRGDQMQNSFCARPVSLVVKPVRLDCRQVTSGFDLVRT